MKPHLERIRAHAAVRYALLAIIATLLAIALIRSAATWLHL
ncbi:MAG TPA: hypothetical protein VFS55_10620 [Dokdonella sp.]|nr:hypothetical protein [Dokdonella sp.]